LPTFHHGNPVFDRISVHAEFVMKKMAVGQVFSRYFGFLSLFSFFHLLHIH
jgi:hypothetical protein